MLNNNSVDLQKNFDTRSRKALETGIKLHERSFTCKDIQMVKIKCSKDDPRVHKLANLFIANGISIEKILVRRTGGACKSYFLLVVIPLVFTFNQYYNSCLYILILFADKYKIHTVSCLKS